MSLRKRFFTIAAVAGATAVFSVVGFGQTTPTTTAPTDKAATERGHRNWDKGQKRGEFGKRHAGMRGHRGFGMMMNGLDLTDAQKTQIQSILAANKPSAEFRTEIQTLRLAQRSGTLTDVQKDRLKAIREDRQAKGKAVHEQILAVLTPEQKAKIEARKAEMKTRMEQRRLMHEQKAPATADKPKN